MLLTMEEIKAQLRLDEDFDADDRHLQLLACAAQKRTETYLNRKLYAPFPSAFVPHRPAVADGGHQHRNPHPAGVGL